VSPGKTEGGTTQIFGQGTVKKRWEQEKEKAGVEGMITRRGVKSQECMDGEKRKTEEKVKRINPNKKKKNRGRGREGEIQQA